LHVKEPSREEKEMPSFNRVMLIGRLTRDPELRYTSTGLAVTTFTIAVDRRTKNQAGEKVTDFFRCKAWRQTAEFVNEYVKKGRLVAVDGRIEMSEYTAQDGTRKTAVDIVCDNVETLDSQRDGGEGGGGFGGGGSYGGRDAAPQEDNGYYPDEEPAQAAPAPRGRQQAAAAHDERPAPRAQAPRGGSSDGARGGQSRGGAPARPAPARQPEPMYPEDDFDDSDPFADE
jgi:single-strand DNA-binding protein